MDRDLLEERCLSREGKDLGDTFRTVLGTHFASTSTRFVRGFVEASCEFSLFVSLPYEHIEQLSGERNC